MNKKKPLSITIKKNILKKTKEYREELIQSLLDPSESSAYLQIALEEYQQDRNVKALLVAIRNVAEAQGGMTHLAKKTHLNRQSLYKILSPTGNPTLDTFGLILKALGFHLLIKATPLKKNDSKMTKVA